MAGVLINCRSFLNKSVHISHCNKYLYLVSRHCLRNGKLVQVAGIIVIDRRPQKAPKITKLLTVCRCRRLNPPEFSECFT